MWGGDTQGGCTASLAVYSQHCVWVCCEQRVRDLRGPPFWGVVYLLLGMASEVQGAGEASAVPPWNNVIEVGEGVVCVCVHADSLTGTVHIQICLSDVYPAGGHHGCDSSSESRR
jgi:hypothetical protein